MERLDALAATERGGKTYFNRIGVAFPAKQGPGWNILLDAMPAPQDGQFKILLREPRQRENTPQNAAMAAGSPLDDEIDF